MRNKHNYWLAFVLGISILLSICYCPTFDRVRDDREIFSYAGMAILRGEVPYRDFFDHKPPVIFFMNAAGQLLGGNWGLWIIDALLALVVTAMLYRRSRQYGLALPWLLPLLFNLMIRNTLVSHGFGMTREFTTFFFVLFFCLLTGKGRFREMLLGMLTGLIFFTQQDQVLPLLPFLLYMILVERTASPLIRPGKFAVGFSVVLLIVILYFAWNHALVYLWEDAFRFNWSWYASQHKSIGDHFRALKQELDDGNYEIPFMIAVILGCISFFSHHKKKGLLLAALAALFLSLAPEFMGSRVRDKMIPTNFIYYVLPLSGSVCTLLFVVFAFGDDLLLANRKIQLPYALLVCCSLGYTALQHATHLGRRDRDWVVTSPELQYLRQHRPADHQLYIFNYDAYIYAYNEMGILAPSRWIYQHMWDWYPRWDADHALLSSISEELLRYQTTYVLLDTTHMSFFANQADATWWMSFMQTWYVPLAIPGAERNILWKRKQEIPQVPKITP